MTTAKRLDHLAFKGPTGRSDRTTEDAPSELQRAFLARFVTSVAVVGAIGCGRPQVPIGVAVVVRSNPSQTQEVRAAVTDARLRGIVALHVDAPSFAAPRTDDAGIDGKLLSARTSYGMADGAKCLELLGDDVLLGELLGSGRRPLAARVLFWKVACSVAMADKVSASRFADQMAVLGLDLPDDVAKASVEVELLVLTARDASKSRPSVPVEVRASTIGAALSTDGRPVQCATPCRLSVSRGTHWFSVERPGYVPTMKRVDVSEASVVTLELAIAPPSLAADQWSRTFAASPAVDGRDSLALLATALRTRRLVYMSVDDGATHGIRGALVVDGEIKARTELRVATKAATPGAAATAFSDLLEQGNVIESTPLYARPLFWLLVGASAVGASLATYAILREPNERTEVRF